MYYGRSKILPYLQGNEVACHDFMDASRRHGTPGAGTEDFITHSDSSSQNISAYASFLSPNSHSLMWKRLGDACLCSGLWCREEPKA